MSTHKHDGMHVSGSGRIIGAAVAAGTNARARADNTTIGTGEASGEGLVELRARLDKLVKALDAARTEVPDADQLLDAAALAREEAGKDRPNKHVLSGILHALQFGAAPVKALADAVSAVRQLVDAVL